MVNRITIEDLFPDESPERQKEIEEALDRYLDLVELIYEDINADPKLRAQFDEVLAKSSDVKTATPRLESEVCEKSVINDQKNCHLE